MRRSQVLPLRRLVVVGATVALLAVLVPSVSAASPRSGDLHVTKECSQYAGAAGGFCTITSSNLPAIKVGTKVIYLTALVWPVLETDIVLDTPDQGNNMAFGHVHLDLQTGVGLVTFSGGTGSFSGFTGSAVVTPTTAKAFGWFWEGTYDFSPAH
jgi:hypothetical protein